MMSDLSPASASEIDAINRDIAAKIAGPEAEISALNRDIAAKHRAASDASVHFKPRHDTTRPARRAARSRLRGRGRRSD